MFMTPERKGAISYRDELMLNKPMSGGPSRKMPAQQTLDPRALGKRDSFLFRSHEHFSRVGGGTDLTSPKAGVRDVQQFFSPQQGRSVELKRGIGAGVRDGGSFLAK